MIDAKYLVPVIEAATYYPTESDRVAAMAANVDSMRNIKSGDIITTVHDVEYVTQTVGRVAAIEIKSVGDGYHFIEIDWDVHYGIRNGVVSGPYYGGGLTVSGGAVLRILESAPEPESEDEYEPESEFGMPESPDAGHGIVCEKEDCVAPATHMALDTDGATKIAVCTIDSYNTRFWGVWPIEEDSQFGDIVTTPDNEPDAPAVGSAKSEPDWTRRTETPIAYNDRKFRAGIVSEKYLYAVINEVTRIMRTRRERTAHIMRIEAQRKLIEGLIGDAYADRLMTEADAYVNGVSLAKA